MCKNILLKRMWSIAHGTVYVSLPHIPRKNFHFPKRNGNYLNLFLSEKQKTFLFFRNTDKFSTKLTFYRTYFLFQFVCLYFVTPNCYFIHNQCPRHSHSTLIEAKLGHIKTRQIAHLKINDTCTTSENIYEQLRLIWPNWLLPLNPDLRTFMAIINTH